MAKRTKDASTGEAGPGRKSRLETELRRRILTMQLAPGAVLDEVELSDEFGLSRPPVRELMRQLAGEGYIDLEPNRPARVASMTYESLRDFYLVAPMIYASTTRLAAERATRLDIEMLKKIQEKFKAAITASKIDDRVFVNNEFHLHIGLISRSLYLLPSLRRLLIDHCRIAKMFYQPNNPSYEEDMDVSADHHDQIIEAMEQQDAELAARIAYAHIELSRKRMAMFAAPEGIEIQRYG